jgi:hypothetical protein
MINIAMRGLRSCARLGQPIDPKLESYAECLPADTGLRYYYQEHNCLLNENVKIADRDCTSLFLRSSKYRHNSDLAIETVPLLEYTSSHCRSSLGSTSHDIWETVENKHGKF